MTRCESECVGIFDHADRFDSGLSRAIQGQVENLATGIQEITEGVISIRKFQTGM